MQILVALISTLSRITTTKQNTLKRSLKTWSRAGYKLSAVE